MLANSANNYQGQTLRTVAMLNPSRWKKHLAKDRGEQNLELHHYWLQQIRVQHQHFNPTQWHCQITSLGQFRDCLEGVIWSGIVEAVCRKAEPWW